MTLFKGALHVHSTYSDGEFSLPELRQLFLAEGCDFVCMSDHANAMDETKVQRYVEECRELSDDALQFVPGLEFDCDRRLQLLGYGVTTLCNATHPVEVIEHVRRERGVAVIAHPRDPEFAWIETFDVAPDGIEVWNSKYDGKRGPRARTFRLLYRMQQRAPGLRAFYGQDLHWRTQYHGLFTEVEAESTARDSVLAALLAGQYQGRKDDSLLPSSGRVGEDLLELFDRRNRGSQRLRTAMMAINRTRRRLGLGIPPAVKALLRRVL
jgi:hypothetical protein